jgi:hypothetical protein
VLWEVEGEKGRPIREAVSTTEPSRERERKREESHNTHTGHTQRTQHYTAKLGNLHAIYITPFGAIHEYTHLPPICDCYRNSKVLNIYRFAWHVLGPQHEKRKPCFVVVNEKPSAEINHVTVICIVSLVFKPQFITIPYVLLCQKMNIRTPEVCLWYF